MARRRKLHLTERGKVEEWEANAAPWQQWGSDLEEAAVQQMRNACSLPVSVAGALMPDAHVGYGLPIGGVLATTGAVIPYAVGVDIACRMCLTVYRLAASRLPGMRDRLRKVLHQETRFGVGCSFSPRRQHPVMDEDWSSIPLLKSLHNKAWAQLGTSGSGNHFVEFGDFTVDQQQAKTLGIEPGCYLALLSHSGSRGSGAEVCREYSWRAMQQHKNLPRELRHLAWLPLSSADGQEYWRAMELMGRYAAANHALIHKYISRALGFDVLLMVDNHHNFAWLETHQLGNKKQEVVVHRKGATPAAKGVRGMIPGSMATPGYLVEGRGKPESLNSAAHGAGRVMSRSAAKNSITWSSVKKQLADAGVELISAGLDEAPGVYKDIEQVMRAQQDLVTILGRFDPRIVKMCHPGERAED